MNNDYYEIKIKQNKPHYVKQCWEKGNKMENKQGKKKNDRN